MEVLCHGETVIAYLILAVLVLSGPLAHLFGVDSRTGDARGGWPGEPRR